MVYWLVLGRNQVYCACCSAQTAHKLVWFSSEKSTTWAKVSSSYGPLAYFSDSFISGKNVVIFSRAYCLNIYTVPSEELAAHPSVARHNRQIITPVKHTNIQHTYMPLTKCIWVVPIQGDIMYNLQNDNKNRHVGVGPRIRGCQKRGLILKWNTYPIFLRYNDNIASLN